MKVNCQEGFRCREHCQVHCYDQDGVLWEEHYMFCGQDETVESFREINHMNTRIIKAAVLVVALSLTTNAQAALFGKSKITKIKEALTNVRRDYAASLQTINNLQAKINELNEVNVSMKRALEMAQSDVTISKSEHEALKSENATLQAMIKQYGTSFDENMKALADAVARLDAINKELDEIEI